MTCSAIHIWGDSVARCVVYNEQRKRYAMSPIRYTSALEEKLRIPVENHALMGMTSVEGLAAFLKSEPAHNSICAIEFGGNDCDLDWSYVAENPEKEIIAKVPLVQYKEALNSFVQAARSRDMHPILVTPVPLHGSRYFHWVTQSLDKNAVLRALHGDPNSIYRWQERYALAVRDVAEATGCPLLDMRDLFLAQIDFESYMCIDGIHPNELGHKLISDSISDFAAKKLACA